MSSTTRTQPDAPWALAAPRIEAPVHRVLLAEEDPQLLDSLSTTLRDTGYAVVTVRAAHELLAVLEDSLHAPDVVPPFQAVVCDVSLAGAGRGPLLSLLRRMNPDVPLLIMTAPDDGLTQAEAFRREADAVLHKPFEPEQLLTALRIIAGPATVRSG